MNSNQILSASMLDIVFDNRNKAYGAYELRNTYSKRMTKALIITACISLLLIAGTVLAKSSKTDKPIFLTKVVTISDVNPIDKKPEIPKPEKKPEPIQVKMIKLTVPEIVNKDILDKPLPENDDLDKAKIGTENIDGIDYNGKEVEKTLNDGKGVFESNKNVEPIGPVSIVELEAKFTGNWEKFLLKNLNGNIPADNGAPAGNHTIIIQFVVDIDGNVSDIKPLTNLGYGMEQEAIRVLKRATKWEPAIQNGRPVKAYKRQPITFVVAEE
jgi:protein TonB